MGKRIENKFIINFRGLAHDWFIDLLDLYITIEIWIISKNSYAKAIIFTTMHFIKTNKYTTSQRTNQTLSPTCRIIWYHHLIVHPKHQYAFSPWTHLGKILIISSLTAKIPTIEKIPGTIFSLLQGGSNSRKMQVSSVRNNKSNKKRTQSNKRNPGTASPQLLLKRTKKIKNLKTPKV